MQETGSGEVGVLAGGGKVDCRKTIAVEKDVQKR